ncbi:hypothetical protein [Flammeovirga agarivorans]|uniref:Uncharacterized protein n=1 Tax=Flammeovirga agarivorans TaxID=2726742 RepID=A0A7X8SKW5_9BACT|nr:hypothetical protein [Flammeovirga agarivorans]NLR92007.1 hypothetical protein [Flammeovirga agarivorans]
MKNIILLIIFMSCTFYGFAQKNIKYYSVDTVELINPYKVFIHKKREANLVCIVDSVNNLKKYSYSDILMDKYIYLDGYYIESTFCEFYDDFNPIIRLNNKIMIQKLETKQFKLVLMRIEDYHQEIIDMDGDIYSEILFKEKYVKNFFLRVLIPICDLKQ